MSYTTDDQSAAESSGTGSSTANNNVATSFSNIYRRKVHGISDGQLANAIIVDHEQQQHRNEPTINVAFSQTSPNIYHHQKAAANASSSLKSGATNGSLQTAPIATWAPSALNQSRLNQQNEEPSTIQHRNELVNDFVDNNDTIVELADGGIALPDVFEQQTSSKNSVFVEPLRAKTVLNGSSVLADIDQTSTLQSSIMTLTWILVAFGIAILTLLVVLVVLVSRAYTVACTNQSASASSPIMPTTTRYSFLSDDDFAEQQ